MIPMMEIVLRIKCPHNWLSSLEKKLDKPIKFLSCKPDGDGGRSLVEINANDEELNSMIETIKSHPSICSVELAPNIEGGVLGTIVTDQCLACKMISGSNCFLTGARTTDDGWVEWNLIAGEGSALKELKNDLTGSGCEVDLLRTKKLTKKQVLTDRQSEIIKWAYKKGYYNQPKEVTIEQLSNDFGISPSTLAEILQRAERKIIGRFIDCS